MRVASLLLLSVTGLFVSVYFTLIYYGLIRPDTKYVPQVCRLDEGGCRRLLDHRHARLFGVPNSLLGILYYVAIIAGVTLAVDSGIMSWITYVSWFVVAAGLFLTYSLFFVVKTRCVLCFLSHALNVLIAIILTL